MSATARIPIAILSLLLALPATAAAHRLDEYLQATRIALDVDCVTVEIDLTAGVGIAPKIVALIDTDRDGRISQAEERAYAQLVLSSVVMEVDDRPRALALIKGEFPPVREMSTGQGTIRLVARAGAPAGATGRHHLFYRNVHRSEMSAYLVNALRPANESIAIGELRRDALQHQLRMTYSVSPIPAARRRPAGQLVAGLALLALLAAALKKGTLNFSAVTRFTRRRARSLSRGSQSVRDPAPANTRATRTRCTPDPRSPA